MIAASVTDTVYRKIMDKDTAYEVLVTLKRHFEAGSEDQLFKFCNYFFAFSWSDREDASTHIAKLLTLWNVLNGGLVA
jgi:hypothetical protein